MATDDVRNAAYAMAIEQSITPGCVVLDLGAGLGVHGLMAARMGAGKVYLVDPSPVVRHAREIARHNGLAERVEVIRGGIEEIELPEAVDVIISVFTGNFLLSEDLLPYLFHARDRFLKPGGRLIPDMARMQAAPVNAPAFHAERIDCWRRFGFGLDFSPLGKFANNAVHYTRLESGAMELLSEPFTLTGLDFTTATSADCRCRREMRVDRDGTCHGILGWFDMRLGDEWLSTGPQARRTHWSMAFLPLDPPLALKQGERLHFQLDRPQFGEWTWTIECGEQSQRHSTFLSQPADIEHLKSQVNTSVPGLSDKGDLARYVLNRMAEGKTTAEILSGARDRYSGAYPMEGQLDRAVRNLIAQWRAIQRN